LSPLYVCQLLARVMQQRSHRCGSSEQWLDTAADHTLHGFCSQQ